MSQETVSVKIQNLRGLHARASAKFCGMASEYKAIIRVICQGVDVGGCSIMGLMMLGAAKGMDIEITANGEDAAEALTALAALVNDKFGEGE